MNSGSKIRKSNRPTTKPGPNTCFLERLLSKRGIASRTEAREWIREGLVKVNGKVQKNSLSLVSIQDTQIEIQNHKTLNPENKRLAHLCEPQCQVILLYKTRGLITTRSDEKGRSTIYSLLPKEFHSFHCVGRLDQATTGLLILTNDTKLSAALTDPLNKIPRTYLVTVRGEVNDEKIQHMVNGFEEDGELLQAVEIIPRKVSRRESHLVVTLRTGKNREIRRLLSAVGNEVTALKRVAFGPYELGDLEPGKWRLI